MPCRVAAVTRRLELWADSFHEGDWGCRQLAAQALGRGGTHVEVLKHGFLPTHSYVTADADFSLTVYGSYTDWTPLPPAVGDLLKWGKPDLVAYDPESQTIVFAVEETAAVPTGNQALQRCERLYGAARSGIPFWYFLPEFGLHIDGGVRRDSIWPTVMALKLSQDKQLPSMVLHYSDEQHPEAYSVGTGLTVLFSTLLDVLANYSGDRDPLHGLRDSLEDQFRTMLAFVGSQWPRMLDFLPGEDALKDSGLPAKYADAATRSEAAADTIWSSRFLTWPPVSGLPSGAKDLQVARELLKDDPLCTRLESDIEGGSAYGLSQNAGSKPQSPARLQTWIEQQSRLFDARAAQLSPPAAWGMRLSEFPESQTGLRHVTTARRILFLYDDWSILRAAVEDVYPRLAGKLPAGPDGRPALVYVSNSIKPGRIFGDPFTGQISAYSITFGRLDPVSRAVLAYFPHQSYTQAEVSAARRDAKGLRIMRELTDVLLFGGGVAVTMPDQRVI
jgi:hypothetical protein